MKSHSPASWTPPADFLRITTLDGHTGGEPLRIVTSGFPPLPGDTILAKRQHAQRHHEPLRRALMWEPRGHADMYGCLLTDPVSEDGDLGVLFLHNEGYSTMCGHAVIGLLSMGLDTGLLTPRDPPTLRLDTPAGRVTARARLATDGRVEEVRFRNVPSFVRHAGLEIALPDRGACTVDVAYGGAFYAIVDAARFGFRLVPEESAALIRVGMQIKQAVSARAPLVHPDGDPDLNFLYGTIFVGPAHDPANHSRNVCIFADGEVDRSPTGTGVSSRAAVHHSRGELGDETIRIESILGTTMSVRVAECTRVGDLEAIVPEVGGRAFLTGRHEFWIDPRDPLREGFLLR